MSRTYPPVSLIGAPTDVGAGHRGSRMGPEALRIAGLGEALIKRGVDVIDRGNLDGPRNPWQKPVEGYRHLPEVVAWNRAVMDAVGAELDEGRSCCGGTRMPISIRTRSRRRATCTACPWPACAVWVRMR